MTAAKPLTSHDNRHPLSTVNIASLLCCVVMPQSTPGYDISKMTNNNRVRDTAVEKFSIPHKELNTLLKQMHRRKFQHYTPIIGKRL